MATRKKTKAQLDKIARDNAHLSEIMLNKKLTDVWETMEIVVPYSAYTDMIEAVRNYVTDNYDIDPSSVQLENNPMCVKTFQDYVDVYKKDFDLEYAEFDISWQDITTLATTLYKPQIDEWVERREAERQAMEAARKSQTKKNTDLRKIGALVEAFGGVDVVLAKLQAEAKALKATTSTKLKKAKV